MDDNTPAEEEASDEEESDSLGDEENAVEADSGEEEEPTPDDVEEGMESETKRLRKQLHKALRLNYSKKTLVTPAVSANGHKALCGSCKKAGKTSCKCGMKSHGKKSAVPGYEEHQKKPGKPDPNSTLADDTDLGHEEHQDKPGSPLQPHEKKAAGEASGFLGEVQQGSDWTREHQMKAYAFHKMLDFSGNSVSVPFGNVGENVGGSGPASSSNTTEKKNIDGEGNEVDAGHKAVSPAAGTDLGHEEEQDKPGEELHPHYKACMGASKFLKSLSDVEQLSQEHRDEASIHHKALDAIGQQEGMANVQEGDDTIEPGEMGQKSILSLKELFLKNMKESEEFNKKLANLR